MTIASEITRIEGNISAAYSAADAKGATMPATENSDNLATCIASIPSGGGGSGKYQLLQRITDDNNNEIGTVSGFFTDANDTEYAVVCLDAQYRLASGEYCSNATTSITNLPLYSDIALSNVWSATETATFNTQKILDYCTAGGYTSSACSHCRSKSFTIDGTTYYGQLPNMQEVNGIVRHYSDINDADTSASSYSALNFTTSRTIWSSSQSFAGYGFAQYANGGCNAYDPLSSQYFIVPVLELPNI